MPQKSFTLPSSLDKNYRDLVNIDITYNSETGYVEVGLLLNEISELYRRLPLQHRFHDYELSASTLLLETLASCTKYARQQKLESLESDELAAKWQCHIDFYSAVFPVLDALADLEALINRFEDKTIDDLTTTLTSYEKKINAIFDKLLTEKVNIIATNQEHENYTQMIEACRTLFTDDLQRFTIHLNLNKFEKNTRALLSNYIISNNLNPLGLFVVQQVKHVTTLLSNYKLMHEEFPGKNYIEKSPDKQKIDVLADDKLAFKQSFAGIRFSTAKPIPDETIEILRTAGGNFDKKDTKKYTIRLNDFLKSTEQTDLNAWERLLCALSNKKPETAGYKSFSQAAYFVSAIIIATIAEVCVTILLRIPANMIVGAFTGIAILLLQLGQLTRRLNEASFETHKTTLQAFLDLSDHWINHLHHTTSANYGLAHLRKQKDQAQIKHYQEKFLISSSYDNNTRQTDLLYAITQKTKSSLALIAAEYFSASFVNQKMVNGVGSIAYFIYETLAGNPGYLSKKIRQKFDNAKTLQQQENNLFTQLIENIETTCKQAGMDEAFIVKLKNLAGVNDITSRSSIIATTNNPMVNPVTSLDSSTIANLETTPAFPRLKPNKVGPAESIMNFAEILFLEFASLINSIFIKMPLASSISQALAFMAFVVTYAGMGGPFPFILNELSLSFTGKSTILENNDFDLFRGILATFLLWKISILLIETVIAIYKRDPHFLEKLYGDPERIFLGLSVCLSLGLSLQIFPLLPETINLFTKGISGIIFGMYPQIVKDFANTALNMYPAMANVFIIEAREAWHGQIPFNFMEYFLLGLKGIFLFGALVSGDHKPHLHANETKLKLIIKQINSADENVDKNIPKAATFIVQLFDALGVAIERKQAKHLFDILSNNHANPELLSDLYNQSVFSGSNNLLQIISLLPGAILTYPYRVAMLLADWSFNASCDIYGIIKNFCEDITMIIQLMAAICEASVRSFLLSINQTIKSLLALVIGLPLHLITGNFRSFDHDILSRIDMHNNILYIPKLIPCVASIPAKSLYGFFAHTAGTNDAHEEIEEALPKHERNSSKLFEKNAVSTLTIEERKGEEATV